VEIESIVDTLMAGKNLAARSNQGLGGGMLLHPNDVRRIGVLPRGISQNECGTMTSKCILHAPPSKHLHVLP
jgi:hypothetical protein